MTLIYCIGLIALFIIAATLGGFFYGKKVEQAKIDKAAITAYQNARDIQNEINNLDDYALCLRVGGLSDKCKVLLFRLGETSEGE